VTRTGPIQTNPGIPVQTLSQIKAMLEQRGLSPRRSLGQNFLIDQNLIRKMVDASGVGPGSLVLEVGPGTGTLSEELLGRGARVVACELDRGLARLLRDELGGRPGFTLIEGDCMETKHTLSARLLAALGDEPFTLVANLPYGVATPLMMTLLTDHPRCGSMFVTIQREVAQRLLAGPGSRAYGTVSVLCGALAGVERMATLGPECFWPRPEVSSAMVAIRRVPRALVDDVGALRAVCNEAFSRRRKQIGPMIRSWGIGPERIPPGIDPGARIEALSVEQIVALARVFAGRSGG